MIEFKEQDSDYCDSCSIVSDELTLIETSSGESFVLAGDGYYTYGGRDSQGYIELGTYVGKY